MLQELLDKDKDDASADTFFSSYSQLQHGKSAFAKIFGGAFAPHSSDSNGGSTSFRDVAAFRPRSMEPAQFDSSRGCDYRDHAYEDHVARKVCVRDLHLLNLYKPRNAFSPDEAGQQQYHKQLIQLDRGIAERVAQGLKSYFDLVPDAGKRNLPQRVVDKVVKKQGQDGPLLQRLSREELSETVLLQKEPPSALLTAEDAPSAQRLVDKETIKLLWQDADVLEHAVLPVLRGAYLKADGERDHNPLGLLDEFKNFVTTISGSNGKLSYGPNKGAATAGSSATSAEGENTIGMVQAGASMTNGPVDAAVERRLSRAQKRATGFDMDEEIQGAGLTSQNLTLTQQKTNLPRSEQAIIVERQNAALETMVQGEHAEAKFAKMLNLGVFTAPF
eukprot:GSA25T00025549001.1